MNKVCLVLSLGLLMTNTQQFCHRLGNQSLTEQTQEAKRTHDAAENRYIQAVANYKKALTNCTSERRIAELLREKENAQTEYVKTKAVYEQAKQKEKQQAVACVNDAAIAQELQKQEDEKLAQHLQNQEYANSNQAHAHYDAPPSYAQATAPDGLAYKVATFNSLVDEIERTDKSTAQQLIKSRYKKYNSCWFCK